MAPPHADKAMRTSLTAGADKVPTGPQLSVADNAAGESPTKTIDMYVDSGSAPKTLSGTPLDLSEGIPWEEEKWPLSQRVSMFRE